MLNQLKHMIYTTINYLEYGLGFINDDQYFHAKLQENARFYGDEFKEFIDETLQIFGDHFDNLTSDWV